MRHTGYLLMHLPASDRLLKESGWNTHSSESTLSFASWQRRIPLAMKSLSSALNAIKTETIADQEAAYYAAIAELKIMKKTKLRSFSANTLLLPCF